MHECAYIIRMMEDALVILFVIYLIFLYSNISISDETHSGHFSSFASPIHNLQTARRLAWSFIVCR
jgi:hypothetical protein